MKTIQVSEYRKQIAKYNKMVLENHDPLYIKVSGEGDVVVIPREDFENLQETIYILKDKITMDSLLNGRINAADRKEKAHTKDMNMVFSDVLPD